MIRSCVSLFERSVFYLQKTLLVLVAVTLLFSLQLTGVFFNTRGRVYGATATTLSFQARLFTSAGAAVSDGSYNMQFSLYDVSSGGSALWTETRLNNASQGVALKYGYFSVDLGSISAFSSTINWDQELWLGMTVRGTGSCSFGACVPTDSEMTPRFKLTAVPYAFSAGQLQKTDSGFTSKLVVATPTTNRTITVPDATGTICLTTGNCAGVGGTGDILQGGNSFTNAMTIGTNDAYSLNLETDGTTRLSVDNAGVATFTGTGGIAVIDTNSRLIEFDSTVGGSTYTVDVSAGGNGLARLCLDEVTAACDTGVQLSYDGTANRFDILTANGAISAGSERLSIVRDTGSVGIGQSAPGANRLVVNNQATTDNILLLQDNGVDVLSVADGGNLTVDTNTFFVDASANAVAIGQTSITSGRSLDVNGSIEVASSGIYIDTQQVLHNSNNALWLELGAPHTRISPSGVASIGNTTPNSDIGLGVRAPASSTYESLLVISPNASTRATVFRGSASQTADLFQLQDSNNNVNALFNATGAQLTLGRIASSGTVTQGLLVLSDGTTSNYGISLQSSTLTNSRTITLPDASGTLCLQATNTCGYVLASLTDNTADALDIQEGSNNYININTTNSSENISFGNTTTNPSFNFLGAGNFIVDTNTLYVSATNDRVAIGTTDVTNGVLTVAGTAPTGANGASIRIDTTLTATAQNQNGLFVRPTVSPSSASTRTYAALNFAVQSSSTNVSGAALVGIYGGGSFSGTGSVGSTYGAYLQNYNNASGTISDAYGLYVDNPSNSGTITRNYGAVLINQTAGSTANVNLVVGNVPSTGTWSIYNQSASNNAFNGNLRIGSTTAPTVALDVTGAGAFSGSLSVNGNTTLGDATSDTVTFTGRVNSNILPSADDTYDLGSTANRWRDLYLGPSSLHVYCTAAECTSARDWALSVDETNGATEGTLRLTLGGSQLLGLTTGGNLQLGSSTTNATAQLLVADSYNQATDPTGVNGAIYYNTNLNALRCYINGAWTGCLSGVNGSGTSGQVSYWNGSNSQTGSASYLFDNSTNRLTISNNQTSNLGITVHNGNAGSSAYSELVLRTDTGWGGVWVNSSGQTAYGGAGSANFGSSGSNTNAAIIANNTPRLIASASGAEIQITAQDGTNEGGQVSFLGAASNSSFVIDNYASNFRVLSGGQTNLAMVNSSGNTTLRGALTVANGSATAPSLNFASATTYGLSYNNSADAPDMWANGPVLTGGTGWAYYSQVAGSYRMGFRGNSTNSYRYLWNADYTMLGTAPNDGYATHTLRVQGTQYVSSTLEVGGTTTLQSTTTINAGLYAAGIQDRAGFTGGWDGNWMNTLWNGACVRQWVDNSDMGNLICPSDERVKKNIQNVAPTDGLQAIMQLNPVTYNFKYGNDQEQHYGFIAQQLQSVLPSVVTNTGMITADTPDGLLRVNTDSLVAVAIKGIQQLNVQVQNIDARLAVVESGNFSGNLSVIGNAQFGGNLTVQGTVEAQTITVLGKIITKGSKPLLNLLTSEPQHDAIVAINGTDVAGTALVTTAATTASDMKLELVFSEVYNQSPSVVMSPIGIESASLQPYIESMSESNVTIGFLQPLAPNKTYSFSYHVIEVEPTD